ncbi:unnamed protein product [Lymnaea stagnalis]|uniref:Transmembrane protein 69 n=1 Tax=Lymnaea stagnalis TaxID=6523 RepID=A0AAV2HKC9_LYMST
MAARQFLTTSMRFNSKSPGHIILWNRSINTTCVLSNTRLQIKVQKEQLTYSNSNGISSLYQPCQLLPMRNAIHEITNGLMTDSKKFTTGSSLNFKSIPKTQLKASSTLQNYERNLGKLSNVLPNFNNLRFVSFKSLFSTPYPFMVYGLGGLIPFLSAPLYMHWTGYYSPSIAYAQLVYGACILSFLGGVSWGSVLNNANKARLASLSYSILLPLAAWPAVLIFPNISSFPLLIGGLSYAGYKDTQNVHYPRWFANLRLLLSTVVVMTLSTTFIFQFTKDTVSTQIGEAKILSPSISEKNA